MLSNSRELLEERELEWIPRLLVVLLISILYFFYSHKLFSFWYLGLMNLEWIALFDFYSLIKFLISLRFIYVCLNFIELICVDVFNSWLVIYCEIEKSTVWLDLHKWKELHAILEIKWHKSSRLNSNLIVEFTNQVMQF